MLPTPGSGTPAPMPTASAISTGTPADPIRSPTPIATPFPTGNPYLTPTPTSTPTPSVDPPSLHTSGQNIYDSNSRQIKLYTLVIQDGDGNHITQTDIQNIKNMGFNSIRIYVEWGLVQPNGPTSINTSYFTQGGSPTIGASVDNVVNWAAQLGMYVEISPCWSSTWNLPSWAITSSGLSSGDYGGRVDMLYNSQIQSGVNYLYQWMAQHYASNSNVIFESFNELSTANTADGGLPFASFNNGWVSAIEQGEGENSHLVIIQMLLSQASWNYIFTPPFVSGSHSNVLLATHDYAPMYGWNQTGPFGPSYVLGRFQECTNVTQAVNMPWIDTEWSKSTDQDQWQLFDQTVLQGYSEYNAVGWAYFCYDSNPWAESLWNINNPTIASMVLPILRPAMTQPG